MAVNDDNKVSIVAAGGIDTILSTLMNHLSNAYVQEYGCGALKNLAVNDYIRVALTAVGGITT